MPNCYYVVRSTPEGTGNDIKRCARAARGEVKFIGKARKDDRIHTLIWFRDMGQAVEQLEKIRDCLIDAGHEVDDYDILEDFVADLQLFDSYD